VNIGHLMRTFLAEAQPQDSKAMELKVGQIVKGIVLQLITEQEALVNINGTQVRAKLETPLQQGQSTLLQVQPESTGGQIVLKPLTQSEVQISHDSMPELLRTLGLKDTSKAREQVNLLHQQGIALTKANVQKIMPVLQSIPGGVPADEWAQSAVVAFQRGLPITDTVVGSLHRAIYGTPIHEQLSTLEQDIAAWRDSGAAQLGRGASGTGGAGAAASVLADKLLSLLASIRGATNQVMSREAASHQQANAVDGEPSAASARPVVTGGTGSGAGGAGAGSSSQAAAPEGAKPLDTAAPVQHKAETPMSPERASRDFHAAALNTASSSERVTPQRDVVTGRAPKLSNEGLENVDSGLDRPLGETVERSTLRAAGGEKDGGWVMKLLRDLGVDHEQQVFKLLARSGLPMTGEQAEAMQISLGGAAAEQSEVTLQDSVKSLLLQLSGSDELPPALKEQVQNTLQQITGQQLLLQGDKGGAFTQLTMFLPMLHGSDGQTSAVHIQSRRSHKGELDAENCRLWFDLHMRSIGDTLMDVQIMNKRVSLVVLNDHPAIASLFEMYRGTLIEGLQNTGYQFLSMKCQPFPKPVLEPDSASNGPGPSGAAAIDSSRSEIAAKYRARPYRGVDVRV
jgi:hypothetical protein